MTEYSHVSHSSFRERDQIVAVSSVFSSSSCDSLDDGSVIHPCDSAASLSSLFFLSSLTVFAKGFLKADFLVQFFHFCTGVTDIGTCRFLFQWFQWQLLLLGLESCSVSQWLDQLHGLFSSH